MIKFKVMLGPAADWPAGSPEWAERMSAMFQTYTRNVNRDTAPFLVNHLREMFSKEPRPWTVWPVPPLLPDAWCKEVTGKEWKGIIALVAEFVGDRKLERTMLAELAGTQARTIKPRARTDLTAAEKPQLRNQGGESSEKLLRRIARARPDLLARYEAGEFDNVRDVAKAAGMIKPSLTPFETVEKLWPKLSDEDKNKIRNWL